MEYNNEAKIIIKSVPILRASKRKTFTLFKPEKIKVSLRSDYRDHRLMPVKTNEIVQLFS